MIDPVSISLISTTVISYLMHAFHYNNHKTLKNRKRRFIPKQKFKNQYD
jgi:hypothetical protein